MLLFLLYAGYFIFQTSFLIQGERYFVLFDDAMISMQYARNLANGHGLVYAVGGERVEGFSNPLWVFYMAFFHLFPFSSAKISLAIQISGVLFLLLNLFTIRKIASLVSEGNWLTPILSVLLTAFYFPLNNWSFQGTEVSLLTLILSNSVLLSLIAQKEKRFSFWPYLLMAIATLVRFDMFVPMIILIAFMAWKDDDHRRLHLKWGLGLLAGALLLQTLPRLWYYGEWLPNTYYLKVIGVSLFDRVKRGIAVFWAVSMGSWMDVNAAAAATAFTLAPKPFLADLSAFGRASCLQHLCRRRCLGTQGRRQPLYCHCHAPLFRALRLHAG